MLSIIFLTHNIENNIIDNIVQSFQKYFLNNWFSEKYFFKNVEKFSKKKIE